MGYQGSLVVGISFRDSEGTTLTSTKQRYDYWGLESTSTSLVYGTETGDATEWMNVGGPIKGSYIVKTHGDRGYDFISDLGVYVDDPCQAVKNLTQSIGLNETHTSVIDLKYHDGTDSSYWLANVC